MLKTNGFAKSSLSRVHNNPFNPLTLSVGATEALSKEAQTPQTVAPPDYEGLGAVYKEHKDLEND